MYLLILLVSVLVAQFLWKRHRNFQVLREAGHVGPEPNFLTGSFFDIKRENAAFIFERWFKEYKSDVVGFYIGSQPVIVTRDVDIGRQIMVKDFSKFVNRAQTLRLEAAHPVISSHVLFVNDLRWKWTRNFMTPSFSTVNMRVMFERLDDCTDIFMENLGKTAGRSFNVYPMARRLTLDNISRSAFSFKTNVQQDPLGPPTAYQKAAEGAIDGLGESWLSPVTQGFKPLGRALFGLLYRAGLFRHAQDDFIVFVREMVKMRETKGDDGEWVDFMQNIINGGKGEQMENRSFHKKLQVKLNYNEVIGNCLLFLTAAFETTSSSLSFLYFNLGRRPEIQKKLRESIVDQMKRENLTKLTYDLVMFNTYLDMVVNESLRLFPVANGFVAREALEDYEFKGCKIPKGAAVLVSAYGIHRDPRNFPNPDEFDPERFSPENKGKIPYCAYIPFGEGQRNCIGNRFALMQLKLALAKTVLRYRISLNEEKHEKEPVILDRANVLFHPKEGVHVRLEAL